jgi:Kef-type K+ transport system membrane component KefB
MESPDVARVVLGLAAALGLAVALTHPRVRAVEDRLGVTVLLASGLPFLVLGAIFSVPSVGVLTPAVLKDLSPAFEFGLGWIGFVIGIQMNVHRLDRLPRALGSVILAEALMPMILTAVFCAAAFTSLTSLLTLDRNVLRDAAVLGACAAPTAAISIPFLSKRVGKRASRLLYEVTLADEVVALAALGMCTVWFRPEGGQQWVLPDTAWLLVCAGLGVILGILAYSLIRSASTRNEEIALLIGVVALSSGMAQQLGLSVPVVGALAGALLANLPLRDPEGLWRTMQEVERPLYLVFLLVVGAMWQPSEWQGWVLAPVFVVARILGKYLGAQISLRVGPAGLPPPRETTLALMPMSPAAVALIVAAAVLYGRDQERIRWSITAVIVGGVLTELVIRLMQGTSPIPREIRDDPSGPLLAPPPVDKDTLR